MIYEVITGGDRHALADDRVGEIAPFDDELQVGVLAGSFSAVLILFSIPITLLGVVSPFAIRLAVITSYSIHYTKLYDGGISRTS